MNRFKGVEPRVNEYHTNGSYHLRQSSQTLPVKAK